MALELTSLVFKTETSDLERASKVIGELVTNVGKLDKAARTAAQTEATLARAAKDSAKANLDNAKAQDVRLKSTITADKADQQAAAAIERKTKATDRASTAIKKNADMLQLQNDTYDFILEGFSKGDAKVLAMAKATGQLSDQLKQVLTDIRQFSKNTFDQTETGLDRMVKSAKEASSAQGFLNNGLNLTSKQAKELSNDLDRLNIRLQHQGKSYQDITKEQAIYKQRFVEEANAVNRATSALAAVEKQRKDVVSATNYLTQAEAKMAAALNTSNAALDKAGTDSLVKYETALRKSGVTQDLMTQKLATYKAQLAQVQEQEMKRREQHLTRAISPQLMDIGVSLYSGQNPLTVLIQQSGQLVDLFQLSGVEAGKLGEAVRKSFYSMVPAIATVTKGLASLFFGMFVDAGRGITSFISNVTGLNKVLQDTDDILYLIGGRVTWFSKILTAMSTAAAVSFGAGLLAIVTGLAALAVGLKQVITENNELAKAFALSGASIGLSHTQMIGYVKTLADSGATTGQATEALIAMAKAGNFTSSEILLVSKSAVEMQKWFGIAIEDTVKQFAKLKEKPVEALLEIAKSSGMVGPEVIKMVQELERAGRSTETASVAMKAYADVTKEQVAQMKTNYNGFALFMIDLGQKIKQFFSDTFKTLFLATDPNQQLEDQLVKLRDRIKEVSGNLQSLGSFGDPKLLNQLKEQERMLISQIGANVRIRGEEEKRKYINAENAKYEEAILKLRQGAEDAIDKETRKTETLADFRKSFIEDKLKDAAKEKAVDVEKLRLNTDLMKLLQQQADIEYKKLHKKDGKQAIKDLETEIDLHNKQLGLLGSFNNELAAIERRRKATGDEDQYQKSLNDLIKKQPIYLERQKEINAAHDLSNKLVGKADMLGKDYYKTLEQIQEFQDSGLYSPEKAEALRKAAYDQTELAKQQLKYVEESTKTYTKYAEESQKSLDNSTLENQRLDDRLALLGLTSEQQKYLKIQQQQRNSLLGVDLKLSTQIAKIWEDVRQGKLDPFDAMAAQLEAEQAATEERKTINREVAVQYAEDLQKEIDAIKNSISDSIVTALFEGGKAGSKKLRNLVVAELKKPVTMVVNAVVNTVLGNTIGSLMGGTGAGGTGSLLSTAGGIGNLLGGLGSFGSTVAGGIGSVVGSIFGVGAGNVALGTSLGLGASSSTAAALAAAQAGGAAGGAGAAGMGSFLSGAGAAMPYIGAAIALISLISGMDDSGTLHTGGAASYSAATGQRNSLGFRDNEEGLPSYNPNDNIDNQFGTGFGWTVPGKETISAMETLSKALVDIFDGIAKTFGKTAGYEVAVAFADDTSDDGAWGAFAVRLQGVEILNWDDFRQSKWAPKEFGDGEEGYKQYLAAVAKDTREVLTSMDIPGWAKTILKDIGENPSMEALSGAIQLLAQVEAVFKSFGQYMPQFANLADSAKETLIRASGGVQALAGNMSSFVNAFYTDAEKLAINSNNLSEALSKLGFEMPKTREEFKALVQSQIELGDSGAESLAALLSLSGAMDAVLPAFNDVTDAVSGLSEVMKGLEEETANLEIELLRAKGDTAGADARQRALDTQGFTEAEIAIYDYNQSIRDQIKVLTEASAETEKQTSTRLGLERQLLQLQGDTEALRLLDIAGMDEYNVKLYDQIQSLTAASSAAATLASNMKNLRAGLISLEGRFTGGGFSKQYKAEDAAKEINSLLASVGINKDVATITSALLNSTTDEVESYFREIWEVLDTDEARLRLVEVSNAMLDIAVASETAAEKFQKQTDALSKLASDVADLFAARNSAGSLLDKIAGAMGNQGSFAAQREGELWSALYSTTDLKKQVDLAEQLTDIVISRQQLEVQNAEKLMEFGRGLKSYVDSLKLGALSPLTNAQKLAEASKQYSETLTKAIGGDVNAQSNLQGISSSFLEIARTYYAGNEDFVNIFNSVTSSLESLGVNSMSEAQQQIAVGNQSLAELQKLYTITESAYSSLNSQYESALSSLVIAQDSLVLQAKSFEQLVAIYDSLASLPSEISARLPNLDVSTPNLVTNTQNGVTVDNTALIEEVKALRLEVARLAAENREDAAKVAAATIMASQANAATITDATTKAARTTEVKQGATIQ